MLPLHVSHCADAIVMVRLSPTTLYLTSAAALGLSFSLLATTSGVYAIREVGLNPLQLVLIGTAVEATVFFFEIPTGVVADAYSRRASVIIGTFLTGGAFILWGSIAQFETIILANVIWGFGHTFRSGGWQAWLTDEVGEDAAANVFLKATQVRLVSGLVGLPIAIVFALIYLGLPFIVGGGVYLVIGVLLLVAMHETPRGQFGERLGALAALASTVKETSMAFRGRFLLVLMLATAIVYGAASEGFDRLGVAIWLQKLELPDLVGLDPIAWFAVFSAGGIALGLLVTEILKRRTDLTSGTGTVRALVPITLVLAGAMAVFGLSEAFWLSLTAMWVAQSMRAAHDPLFLAWVNRGLDPRTRATVLSTFGQGDAVGQMSIGPVIGWIGLVRSASAAIVTSALLLGPAVGIYAASARRPADESAVAPEEAE